MAENDKYHIYLDVRGSSICIGHAATAKEAMWKAKALVESLNVKIFNPETGQVVRKHLPVSELMMK